MTIKTIMILLLCMYPNENDKTEHSKTFEEGRFGCTERKCIFLYSLFKIIFLLRFQMYRM